MKGSSQKNNALMFHFDGDDLSKQSMKDTQTCIDEVLGVGSQVLARTIFNGQHNMNGLLNSSDSRLKDELSLVSSLSVWQACASLTREQSQSITEEATKDNVLLTMRYKDVEILKSKADASALLLKNRKVDLEMRRKESVTDSIVSSQIQHQRDVDAETKSLQCQIDKAMQEYQASTIILNENSNKRNIEMKELNNSADLAEVSYRKARENLAASERKVDRIEARLKTSKFALDGMITKWDGLKNNESNSDVKICPTCKQTVSDDETGHFHTDLLTLMRNETSNAKQDVKTIEKDFLNISKEHDNCIEHVRNIEREVLEKTEKLTKVRNSWRKRIEVLESKVSSCRNSHMNLSHSIADLMKQKQKLESNKSKTFAASIEIQRLQDAYDTATTMHDSLLDELKNMEEVVKELKQKVDVAKQESAIIRALTQCFGIKGVQTFVLQNVVEDLEASTQIYLDELSDGTQKLELSLDAGDKISRRAQVLGGNGEWAERSLSALSGGQWRRCSLSLSLGFVDLLAQRGCLRPSLLVLDEPLTHLDATGRSHVGSLLRKMLRNVEVDSFRQEHLNLSTILIILQDLAAEELEEAFDHIDEVRKEGGISKVFLDDSSS